MCRSVGSDDLEAGRGREGGGAKFQADLINTLVPLDLARTTNFGRIAHVGE